MKRYWVDKKDIQKEKVVFSGDIFHHIFAVCRQDVGSKFEVLSNGSKAYFVEVIDKSKNLAIAEILEERAIAPLPKPYIHLCLSLPRFSRADEIIEKCVELGVATVRPFISDYSFVRSLNKISENKKIRWQKIVRGATQQCGRGELMNVEEPLTLSDLLKSFNQIDAAAGLFPYEGEASTDIQQALKALKQACAEEVWVFVGSEGGFSESEVELFSRYCLAPVTLGHQVLRVETACLAMISIIKYEFGMMSF